MRLQFLPTSPQGGRERPFRGLRPIQLVLTLFFSPIILFGKRDVRWAGGERGTRCLRITPFVQRPRPL